jgi:ribosomal protein L37AE/L43A
MKKCECPCNIIYGPGDDDYGRDNFIEDWECPQCHEKSPFTRRHIRMGVDECPKCHWLSDYGQKVHDLVERIAEIEKKKKNGEM